MKSGRGFDAAKMMAVNFGVQSSYSLEVPNFGLSESAAYSVGDLQKFGQEFCEYLGVFFAFRSTVSFDEQARRGIEAS